MDHGKRDHYAPAEPVPAAAPDSESHGRPSVAGLSPEQLELMALRRASRGRVAKSGDHYFDHGWPIPSYLTAALNNLVDTGLLALAEEDPWCLRRVSLTEIGQSRYAELSAIPHRAAVRRPEVQFPAKTPAGCQPSCPKPLPVPGSQPDFIHLKSTVEQLRWAHDLNDGQLHLLTPAAIAAATSQDHAHAICAQPILARYLAITYGSPASLCAVCLAGVSTALPEPGPGDAGS